MDINLIYTFFISGFAGALALFWISEIIVTHKSTLIKKAKHALIFAILSVLSIQVYEFSLVIGRVAFMLLNLIWLKGLLKRDWTNTILAYTLATSLALLTNYIAVYTEILLPSFGVHHYVVASFAAIGLATLLPVRAIYNFFVDRVNKRYTLLLSISVSLLLMYSTHVTMGDGGNVVFNAIVATAIVVALLIFSILAKFLEGLRKQQEASGEHKEIVEIIYNEEDQEKLSALKMIISKLKKKK